MNDARLKYVIITPARNEEKNIERLIECVVAQTIRPERWIIVDDRSGDRTAEIVQRYASLHPFISLLSIKGSQEHAFSRKAAAFNSAIAFLKESCSYAFIGNLDADISIAERYFENLLGKFRANDSLGITGGIVYTSTRGGFETFDGNPNSVGGAVQLFRRECFESIGGKYLPLPYGGIDAAAELAAKAKGWKVEKSLDDKVYEHRQTGTATCGPVASAFRLGRRFHSLGYSFHYYILRCVYRFSDPPFLIGSFASMAGYTLAVLRRNPVAVPLEVAQFVRQDERQKLLRKKS